MAWKAQKYHHLSSFDVLQFEDATIDLIEEFPCSTKADLLSREGFWITELDAINERVAGRGYQQYYKDNKQRILEREQKYRDKHKNEKHARDALYRKSHKEQVANQQRRYKELNKERLVVRDMNYRTGKKMDRCMEWVRSRDEVIDQLLSKYFTR